jgi:DMSO reductase family type II enzyme heme b subunit
MWLTKLSRKDRKISLALWLLVSSFVVGVVALGGAKPASAQNQFVNLTSYRVTGAPNYTAPGSESFWNTIDWTNVPLTASVSPGGGHTPDVLVKSANDGFNIYMLFRWNDSAGPSFGASTEVYKTGNGSLLPLNPAATANVTQLFYNSTYYYPDRVAMLWFLSTALTRQQTPAMVLGSNGAITGGAANIWHWQSNPTDNDPNDAGFPGGYTNPTGTPIFSNDNVSFAEDDYTNTTGFYVVGGSFGTSSPNLDPYADPFDVHVGNYFSATNKTWTVEMVRSLSTSDQMYRVQLATGSTYYVAFAVWNGKMGESSHLKSVSQWYTLTISDQPPPASYAPPTPQPQTNAGISPMLAAVVGIGLLLVGVILGVTVRPKRKDEV